MAEPASAGEGTRLPPEFLRLAAVMLTGVLAVVFDTTIVSVALRTLSRELSVSIATIQWVTTGYLLALGIAVPVTGWLVDRFGSKRTWMVSLAIFLVGSVGSSLAPSATALIITRVVQGIGGGLMLPVMQTVLVRAVGGRGLGRATSIIALPALLGPVVGPMLGGLIVDHWSWRWIFWVNIPFCVIGEILAWRFMPADKGDGKLRLDATGLVLLSPAIAAVLYGLSQIGSVGHVVDPSVLAPLAAGLVLLGAFTWRALRVPAPLLDLRLLRGRALSSSSVLLFLSGFVLYGPMLLMPLYFQELRGLSAFQAGLLLAPQGIGIMVSRPLVGGLTDRIGARWIVFTGMLITAAATIPFAFAGASTSEWLLAGVLVIRGIGLGGVTLPLFATSYLGLGRAAVADASIIVRTAQQIGGSFGAAVLTLILTSELQHAGGAAGFQHAFWWTVAFTAAAVVLALWLPVLHRDASPPSGGGAVAVRPAATSPRP